LKPSHVIVDEGIMLRPLEERDLETVRRWRNQDHIRFNFINSNRITREGQKAWYSNYLQRDDDLMFIIEDTGELKCSVGTVALYNIDRLNLRAEFGRLMIGHAGARGKGLAFKATCLLCRFAFETLGLKEIYLRVFDGNRPAINLYRKAGFTVVGGGENHRLLYMRVVLL